MIVRCKECVSAFAVDDEKVANKKFAFTCPKCGTENIFDNRGTIATATPAVFPGEELFDDAFEEKEQPGAALPDDDIFSGEHVPEKGKSADDEFLIPDEALPEEPVQRKSGRNLNLDIEEAPDESPENDFSFSDDDILFDEEPAPAGKENAGENAPGEGDDLFFDELEGEVSEAKGSENIPDLDEPDFTSIDLDSELAGFDEGGSDGKKIEDAGLADELIVPDNEEFETAETSADSDIFGELEESPGSGRKEKDKKLTSQSDIDALFAGTADIEAAKPEDDISVDLDSLDIELEGEPVSAEPFEQVESLPVDDVVSFDEVEAPAVKSDEDEISFDLDILDIPEEAAPEKISGTKNEPLAEDDITIDIDSLDIDVEEPLEVPPPGKGETSGTVASVPDFDAFDAEPEKPVPGKAHVPIEKDDDITLDIDSLDIELEKPEGETQSDDVLFDQEEIDIDSLDFGTEESSPVASPGKPQNHDDDITLDIDSLDIDLEEPVDESIRALAAEETPAGTGDDSITLDMDSLDIDLEEPVFDKEPAVEEPVIDEQDIEIDIDSLDFEPDEVPVPREKKNVRDIIREHSEGAEDEDIKLNLDELDIDIDEISEKDMDFVTRKSDQRPARKAVLEEAPEDEDESITIDLDSLDIDVADSSVVMDSEISEEDEKLTLDDAGMTFDELTADEKKSTISEFGDEEDIKLTLDEVDPDLRLEQIGEVASPDEPLLSEEIDELPEVAFDDEPVTVPSGSKAGEEYDTTDFVEDETDIFDAEPEIIPAPVSRYSDDFGAEGGSESTYPSRGSSSFTIDFSLKYSRIIALLKLLQVYTFSMLPHFIVILIYTVMSGILGFINQIVILSTGRCVEDFAQITENTLRYYLYMKTCVTGIVEDRPEYAGRERIDHQMQLDITYPLKYSKVLAVLRLSIIGILVVSLPHIVMMLFITCFVPLLYLVGIIAVIITGRWPNPIFKVLTMYFRYMAKISAFMTGITDEYPSFKFE